MKAGRHNLTGLLVTLSVITSFAVPATANAWSYASMGGRVDVSGRQISLTDTKGDGRFVTTEFRYNNGRSTSGLSNKLGYGTTTSAIVSSNITNAKICRSNPFPLPVDCGSWRF